MRALGVGNTMPTGRARHSDALFKVIGGSSLLIHRGGRNFQGIKGKKLLMTLPSICFKAMGYEESHFFHSKIQVFSSS